MPHGNEKQLMHVHFYSSYYRAVANFLLHTSMEHDL